MYSFKKPKLVAVPTGISTSASILAIDIGCPDVGNGILNTL
jgi:hypothetical protein